MFSWKQAQERALEEKIRKAKIQAKTQHPDFKKAYPDEARDAGDLNNPKYTLLTARVKKDFEKHLKTVKERNEKIGRQV
jgi:hypothetical protein